MSKVKIEKLDDGAGSLEAQNFLTRSSSNPVKIERKHFRIENLIQLMGDGGLGLNVFINCHATMMF